MRKILLISLALLVLPVLPALLTYAVHPERPQYRSPAALAEGEVLLAEASGWENVLWLDARSAEQFTGGHIPGALLLNEDAWDDLLGPVLMEWTPDRPVVVYCSTQECAASHQVAGRLREQAGMENVHVLKGGWEAWQTR